MRSIRSHCAAAVAVLALAAAAPSFAAVGWAAPVDGGEIVTPYAAVYAGKTHRGVDIAAPAGSPVVAPAEGRVVFAGRVPADGGGTCGAVTIELADGLRVSCLPLADIAVEQGGYVAAGETVGTVAPVGDDSSPEPHLHLGLRRGDEYVDPTGMLPACGPVAADPPALSVEPAPTDSAGGDGPATGPVTIADPTAAGAGACVPAASLTPIATTVPAAAPCPAPRTVPLQHPVPEGAHVPGASQVVVAVPGAGARLRVRANVVGSTPSSPIAWAGPGVLLLVAAALALRRETAHDRIE